MKGTHASDGPAVDRSNFLEFQARDGPMPQNIAVTGSASLASQPVIGPLAERDLPEADRIFRTAFGTFLGVPEPETFWTDRDYLYGRWRAPHVAAFGATSDGRLVGSNFATRWGTVGFFGPITADPALQERGIGKALLAATMDQFDAWGTTHTGLFTFAHSAKHVALYQKFGFYARFLTAIMSAPAQPAQTTTSWSRYSALSDAEKAIALRAAREVTETLYPGLDLSDEIRAVHDQDLGETVLVHGAAGPAAFAVCHYGPRSEAGLGACFVKFGAVRDTPSAEQDYLRLLDACGALAAAVGMPTILAGANLARREAYQHLVARGFRTAIQGVAMHKDNEPGYCRPGVYIIDDWR
jgi:GNAT superfamily N-acetyltransferase